MVYCCVPNCKSHGGKTKNVSFHEFPSDSILRQKWLKRISREGKSKDAIWLPTDHSVVCSKHFKPSDFKEHCTRRVLKPGVEPTNFDCYQPKMKNKLILQVDPENMPLSSFNNAYSEQQFSSISSESVFQDNSQCTLAESRHKFPSTQSLTIEIDDPHDSSNEMQSESDSDIDGDLQSDPSNVICVDEQQGEVTEEENFVNKSLIDHPLNIPNEACQDLSEICSSPNPLPFDKLEQTLHDTLALLNSENINSSNIAKRLLIDNLSLKSKLTREKTKSKLLKKKIENMQKQMKRIKNNSEVFPNDIKLESLRKDCLKGNETALFIMEQAKAYKTRNPKWSKCTLKKCSLWREKSQSSYEYVRKNQLLKLPTAHILRKFNDCY